MLPNIDFVKGEPTYPYKHNAILFLLLIIYINILNKNSKIFHHLNPFTIGIEEEYMICHPETGELINKADDIMSILSKDLTSRYSYELILSEIEVNTSVCNSVKEAMNEIKYLRQNTKKIGEALEYKIGISGTQNVINLTVYGLELT